MLCQGRTIFYEGSVLFLYVTGIKTCPDAGRVQKAARDGTP
ncbi:hypothetical protein DA2_3051 [Desulfovibrio sp. A2]|nr:hypothetical protein DA2_3051 [Desulfovibrio sp. A2]